MHAVSHDHSLAASIHYRALLDDILQKGRSKAYGYAARYLNKLALFADEVDADPARPTDFPTHAAYVDQLKSTHGRKSGFWNRVSDKD